MELIKEKASVAVVIPAYRVKKQILDVLSRIGQEVYAIYVVDDCCPEGSGHHVAVSCADSRIKVLFHNENKGVTSSRNSE